MRVADHVARDDSLLDLSRALVNTKQANIAIETFDLIFGHIAGASMNLHGAIGDATNSRRIRYTLAELAALAPSKVGAGNTQAAS